MKIEHKLLLNYIDDGWANHLATIANIRESVHLTIKLTDIGGLDPYLN